MRPRPGPTKRSLHDETDGSDGARPRNASCVLVAGRKQLVVDPQRPVATVSPRNADFPRRHSTRGSNGSSDRRAHSSDPTALDCGARGRTPGNRRRPRPSRSEARPDERSSAGGDLASRSEVPTGRSWCAARRGRLPRRPRHSKRRVRFQARPKCGLGAPGRPRAMKARSRSRRRPRRAGELERLHDQARSGPDPQIGARADAVDRRAKVRQARDRLGGGLQAAPRCQRVDRGPRQGR